MRDVERRAGVFLNVSNHPSSAWPEAQLGAARELAGGDVRDLPFPAVDPHVDADAVLALGRHLFERIVAEDPAVVLVAGETGVAYCVTALLLDRRVRVVSATAERIAVESRQGDASIKQSEFRFVRWREVRSPLCGD